MPAERPTDISVSRVPVELVRPLRLEVLRRGRPPEEVRAPTDDLPGTVHFAARRNGEVVGVMTVFPDPSPRGEERALRIRWMAVIPALQGSGVGRLLLDEALLLAQERSAPVLWAHARDTALGFYERNGFEPTGRSHIEAETGIAHTPVERRVALYPLPA